MLKLEHKLYFPRLLRIGETTFKSWGESQETTSVYVLDWNEKERVKKEKHEKWMKSYHPTLNIPFMDDLPEPYNSWMRQMQYAIPVKYLREIRRCAQSAIYEYNIPSRPFDTMIREICLDPGIKFVYVAFRLVADCAYDPNTEYFYRLEDKQFLNNALLYKFWMNQTGRGMVWFHAEMDRLSNRAGRMREDSPLKKGMNKFIRTIKEQEAWIGEKLQPVLADQGKGEEEKTKIKKKKEKKDG